MRPACQIERDGIAGQADALQFFVGESVTLAGFSISCSIQSNDTLTPFQYNGNENVDTPAFELVAEELGSDYFTACVNPRSGVSVITPTQAWEQGGMVRLQARDNVSNTAVIAEFNMSIRARGEFRLRPGQCGVEQRNAIAADPW